MKKYDLEERLIDFAVKIIRIADAIPRTQIGMHLANQLIRSGSSPVLNYGEAQAGESKKDFIHKMKIALKELRETFVCLKILSRSGIIEYDEQLNKILNENNELISIFVRSVMTAEKNLN